MLKADSAVVFLGMAALVVLGGCSGDAQPPDATPSTSTQERYAPSTRVATATPDPDEWTSEGQSTFTTPYRPVLTQLVLETLGEVTCAFTSRGMGLLMPQGFSTRSDDPTVLINEQGRVVAKEGDWVSIDLVSERNYDQRRLDWAGCPATREIRSVYDIGTYEPIPYPTPAPSLSPPPVDPNDLETPSDEEIARVRLERPDVKEQDIVTFLALEVRGEDLHEQFLGDEHYIGFYVASYLNIHLVWEVVEVEVEGELTYEWFAPAWIGDSHVINVDAVIRSKDDVPELMRQWQSDLSEVGIGAVASVDYWRNEPLTEIPVVFSDEWVVTYEVAFDDAAAAVAALGGSPELGVALVEHGSVLIEDGLYVLVSR